MPSAVDSLRFVSHSGLITNLRRLHQRTMFVLDSNVILALTNSQKRGEPPPLPYRNLLLATRQRAHVDWRVRKRFIPIDPVFAVMELTKQNSRADYAIYRSYFDDFFRKIYQIDDYDPAWVAATYDAAIGTVNSFHCAVSETIAKIRTLVPIHGKQSNQRILDACDQYLTWILEKRNSLAVIGGPLLQLAVYAIAGDPHARRFLKLGHGANESDEFVAANVAWDMMYWIHLETNYHFKRYEGTVICTSDHALVQLLCHRKNMGPRLDPSEIQGVTDFSSMGIFTLPSIARIDDTKLGPEISKRLMRFWLHLDEESTDDVKFGLKNLFRPEP